MASRTANITVTTNLQQLYGLVNTALLAANEPRLSDILSNVDILTITIRESSAVSELLFSDSSNGQTGSRLLNGQEKSWGGMHKGAISLLTKFVKGDVGGTDILVEMEF